MRDSFVLYTEYRETVMEMSDAEAGALLKMIFNYEAEKDLNEDFPEFDQYGEAYIAFSFIRRQLEKTDQKYADALEKQREAGKRGAEKRWGKADDRAAIGTDRVAIGSDGVECHHDNDNDIKEKDIPKGISKEKAPKHKHGRYSHCALTDEEVRKLEEEYGKEQAQAAIEYLDEYIEMKGYKAKSHYLAIRKWVFNAMKEDEIRRNRNGPVKQEESDDEFYARLEREYSGI